jgi:orotate phosphoribosyltransferase
MTTSGESGFTNDRWSYSPVAGLPNTRLLGSALVSEREDLLKLIKDLAVVHGKVVLSSGREADWYIDLRRITLHRQAAPLVGRVMLDVCAGWTFDAVGGLTLGADPVATAMLHASGGAVDAFVVRKEGKAHGLQRRIEGPDVAGRSVVAVEDTSTTGSSVLTAVDALREAEASIAGVAVIVDRGARAAVEQAGLEYRAAYTLDELGLG